MRVAVLSGGRSSEHEVSLRSGEAVARGLEQAGHEVLSVTISREGSWSLHGATVELVPAAGLAGADVAFPALHGPFGEDGSVQGVLEWLDVPYVGSDVLASAVCMDKLTLKRIFAQHRLPQVEFVAAGEEGWRERCEAMGLPLWVKPSRLGSSVGITRVEALGEALDAAVGLALRHDPRVIVEASAPGHEVECSLLGNDRVEASPPGEVIAHGDWYDYETKYSAGGMELVVPAPLAAEQAARLQELAIEAFRVGGCAGLARCDFFVEPSGEILVNEINTMPGFTETSVYAKLWQAGGLPYPDLCNRLVNLALERHRQSRSHQF
ncbi:MAG TPA: D-alanine--D-alanine ligase family protein [Solirubrobacterales bacterium]|jgi:D-alanine-D-alanine ligase|nr:D-alanine--D-alanine ligase family protein [Solirubrobacterales bacterium]